MVSRPKNCAEINVDGLTSMKCTQSTFPGVLKYLGVLWCEEMVLKYTFHCVCQYHASM